MKTTIAKTIASLAFSGLVTGSLMVTAAVPASAETIWAKGKFTINGSREWATQTTHDLSRVSGLGYPNEGVIVYCGSSTPSAERIRIRDLQTTNDKGDDVVGWVKKSHLRYNCPSAG